MFLCVVTYGRTGSTLLQNYLNSFDDVLIRGENGNILYHLSKVLDIVEVSDNFALRRKATNLTVDSELRHLRSKVGKPVDPWFGAERVLLDKLRADIGAVFIDNFIQPSPHHRIIGFKEVRWYNNPKYFTNLLTQCRNTFRNVKFIFLTRNWEQVRKSSWWTKLPEEQARAKIESADTAFLEYLRNNDGCMLLDYERMTQSTDGFRDVASFIGRPFDENKAAMILEKRLTH